MNNAVKCILAFSLGAAAGSLVTWRVLKTKYEKLTQQEIDSYKEYIKSKNTNSEEPSETIKDETEDDSDEEDPTAPLSGLIGLYRSDDDRKEDDRRLKIAYSTRVISPEEYDDYPDYEKKSFTYYADGVIADEHDNVVENAEDILGEDIESHFGEYDDDSVFVRNDTLKCDYEILRDIQTYADVMGISDHPYDTEE